MAVDMASEAVVWTNVSLLSVGRETCQLHFAYRGLLRVDAER